MNVALYVSFGFGANMFIFGTSIIRFLYIRSSFNDKIQSVLKRNEFVVKSVAMVLSYAGIIFFNHYFDLLSLTEREHIPWLMYKACVNASERSVVPLEKIGGAVHHIVVHTGTITSILSNIYLFK